MILLQMFSGYLGRAEASGGSREAGAFHCHSQYTGGQYQLEYQLEVVSVGDRYQWKVFGRWEISVNCRSPSIGSYQLDVSISSVWSESILGQYQLEVSISWNLISIWRSLSIGGQDHFGIDINLDVNLN
jgi:hypothetical protein